MPQYQPNWSPYSTYTGFVPPQPQSVTQNVPPQQNTSNGGLTGFWTATVNGVEGAEAYPVAAGSTVLLIDFNSKKFWLKSTDASGFPQPLRSFDFVEKIQNGVEKADYVTRKEFEELKQLLEDLTYDRKRTLPSWHRGAEMGSQKIPNRRRIVNSSR